MGNYIQYKGKGEHSVHELEKIIEQREEELHLIKSGQIKVKDSSIFDESDIIKRKIAMEWWNNLSSLGKTQICDTNTDYLGSCRRHETLTGKEIEKLYSWRTIYWDKNK
jgi:hypothetical protein